MRALVITPECRPRELAATRTHELGQDESFLLASLKAATSDTNASIFAARNYKIPIDFGLSHKCLSPGAFVYDSGSEPNLINWYKEPADDLHAIRPVDISLLRTAKKSTLTICGMVPLYVPMGHLSHRLA